MSNFNVERRWWLGSHTRSRKGNRSLPFLNVPLISCILATDNHSWLSAYQLKFIQEGCYTVKGSMILKAFSHIQSSGRALVVTWASYCRATVFHFHAIFLPTMHCMCASGGGGHILIWGDHWASYIGNGYITVQTVVVKFTHYLGWMNVYSLPENS